ncbi:MAG: hypothetical protein ACQETI_01705 [Halobacteriota archaeon]
MRWSGAHSHHGPWRLGVAAVAGVVAAAVLGVVSSVLSPLAIAVTVYVVSVVFVGVAVGVATHPVTLVALAVGLSAFGMLSVVGGNGGLYVYPLLAATPVTLVWAAFRQLRGTSVTQ